MENCAEGELVFYNYGLVGEHFTISSYFEVLGKI